MLVFINLSDGSVTMGNDKDVSYFVWGTTGDVIDFFGTWQSR